jgi:glycosyltransferase involved in cell wall biosynthesis
LTTSPPSPIAVVVPVWNRDKLIVRCLDGVLAQTRAPARIIVVDDGSTDGTAGAVEGWIRAQRMARNALLMRQPHRGAAAARNAGFAMAGDLPLVAFLDSDDLWPADFLARAAAALEARPDAVAASTDRLRHDLRGNTRRREDLSGLAVDPVTWIFRYGAGLGSCTLLRSAAVRAAGGYPEKYPTGHDIVLFCRVAGLGAWIHCRGDPATFLRKHADRTRQAAHLYEYYPEHNLIWANAYEQMAREIGAAQSHVPALRHALARRWLRAGVALELLGHHRKASECFARSIRRRPLRMRAWAGLLRASLLSTGKP